MKFEEIIEQYDLTPTNPDTSPEGRLTRKSGREYAYGGPASFRVTRKGKLDLLRERDPRIIRDALENAFKAIIAASSGTPIQQTAVSKINILRRQLFQKLDQEIEKLEKQQR